MPPKKKLSAVIKLQIQAGAATPAPPVEISVFEDRSFTFVTKTPPAARLILKAAGLDKGSSTPHTVKAGSLSREQVREIAQTKMPDLNALDLDAAEKIIAGTARQMGITVRD
jgi:large subunit ribosomal protein L11